MIKISLSDIENLLLNPNLHESDHVKNIKLISANFTTSRDKIKNYVLNEDLVSSYALFYLPTNLPKFEFVFSKLDKEIQAKIKSSTFIDYGSGPGTYSYGISLINPSQKIICVDQSDFMLKQAENILVNKFDSKNFEFKKNIVGEIKNSTLFFGNSINEIGVEQAWLLINKINPDIVMFIEPGTSELFLELKRLRTRLIENHYNVSYPCPSVLECPTNWCHQVLRATHDQSVERLSQLVSLDRRTMPFCGHVYSKKEEFFSLNDEYLHARIIQFLGETKFSFNYVVCLRDVNEMKVQQIEIMKKNLSEEEKKRIEKINIGDSIRFKRDKENSGKWRVSSILFF